MERPPVLPLPVDQLPENLRRFGDPSAPGPARLMAARGMVPIKGGGLVGLLCQLAADADSAVSAAAVGTLEGMPENVLLPACAESMNPSFIDALADRFGRRDEVLQALLLNGETADSTIARIARFCSERLTEVIATNQQRLLGAPAIVESLYKNKHARMSTIDRLVELCARNGVELDIPTFKDHVEAIQGQLIPEATDEALPSDAVFAAAVAESEEIDEDAIRDGIVVDKDEGTESVQGSLKPLGFRIRQMNTAEKLRMAVVGDAAARALLIRDNNKQVANAAISSPSTTLKEAVDIAHSREVSEAILRYVGTRKEWLRSYELKHALIMNPKCPTGIGLRFVSHMRPNDLKGISKSKSVAQPVRTAARTRLEQAEKKQRGGKK